MGFHTKTPRLQARYTINPCYTIFITPIIVTFKDKCQVFFSQKNPADNSINETPSGLFLSKSKLGFSWLDHFVDDAIFDRIFCAHPEVPLHIGFDLLDLLANVFRHNSCKPFLDL